jgi:hypothetical protein
VDLPTHADVLQWLPQDIQKALTEAMGPEMRGWYTADEAQADGGRFVEVQDMGEAAPRLYRTGD